MVASMNPPIPPSPIVATAAPPAQIEPPLAVGLVPSALPGHVPAPAGVPFAADSMAMARMAALERENFALRDQIRDVTHLLQVKDTEIALKYAVLQAKERENALARNRLQWLEAALRQASEVTAASASNPTRQQTTETVENTDTAAQATPQHEPQTPRAARPSSQDAPAHDSGHNGTTSAATPVKETSDTTAKAKSKRSRNRTKSDASQGSSPSIAAATASTARSPAAPSPASVPDGSLAQGMPPPLDLGEAQLQQKRRSSSETTAETNAGTTSNSGDFQSPASAARRPSTAADAPVAFVDHTAGLSSSPAVRSTSKRMAIKDPVSGKEIEDIAAVASPSPATSAVAGASPSPATSGVNKKFAIIDPVSGKEIEVTRKTEASRVKPTLVSLDAITEGSARPGGTGTQPLLGTMQPSLAGVGLPPPMPGIPDLPPLLGQPALSGLAAIPPSTPIPPPATLGLGLPAPPTLFPPVSPGILSIPPPSLDLLGTWPQRPPPGMMPSPADVATMALPFSCPFPGTAVAAPPEHFDSMIPPADVAALVRPMPTVPPPPIQVVGAPAPVTSTTARDATALVGDIGRLPLDAFGDGGLVQIARGPLASPGATGCAIKFGDFSPASDQLLLPPSVATSASFGPIGSPAGGFSVSPQGTPLGPMPLTAPPMPTDMPLVGPCAPLGGVPPSVPPTIGVSSVPPGYSPAPPPLVQYPPPPLANGAYGAMPAGGFDLQQPTIPADLLSFAGPGSNGFPPLAGTLNDPAIVHAGPARDPGDPRTATLPPWAALPPCGAPPVTPLPVPPS